MSLTYIIVNLRESDKAFDNNGIPLKEILLTDLNSNNNFKIRVRIIAPNLSPKTGMVIEGPSNWLNREVLIHHEDGITDLNYWKVGDRIIDDNPINE